MKQIEADYWRIVAEGTGVTAIWDEKTQKAAPILSLRTEAADQRDNRIMAECATVQLHYNPGIIRHLSYAGFGLDEDEWNTAFGQE